MEITLARYVPGFTSMYQHKLYKDVVDLLPEKPRFLEIGVSLGRSSWAWLDVLPGDAHYDALDAFDIGPEDIPDFNKNVGRKPSTPGNHLDCWEGIANLLKTMSHREVWNFVLQHHPKFHIIKFVLTMRLQQYIQDEYEVNYDAIFIDANHSYDGVMQTLEHFKNTKVICGDDYGNPDWPGVEKAVKEFAKKYNFKLTEHRKNLFFILEKQ